MWMPPPGRSRGCRRQGRSPGYWRLRSPRSSCTPRDAASPLWTCWSGRRISTMLSSRRGSGCGVVGGVVAEHGPLDVEASAGQGEDGLGVGFAFGSLAVVVDAGGGIGADGDLGGQVAGSKESPVGAAGGVWGGGGWG